MKELLDIELRIKINEPSPNPILTLKILTDYMRHLLLCNMTSFSAKFKIFENEGNQIGQEFRYSDKSVLYFDGRDE